MAQQRHDHSIHESDPSRLRIGFFTDVYVPQVNGVAISVALLTDQLRAMGHTVDVFAPQFPGYREQAAHVHRVPSVRYLQTPPIDIALPGMPRATWELNRMKLDIIHSHTPLTLGFLACLAARSKRLPLVSTYHTSIVDYTHYLKAFSDGPRIKRVARRLSALSCNICDQIVVPSAKFERLLRGQQVRRPIQVIPNGIDLARFGAPGPRGGFRQKLGLSPDDFLLLAVGRLEVEKSLDFMIEAFARLAHEVPRTRLVLAGDGSARAALEGLAEKSGVVERILFTGMVDRPELPALFRDADLYLSTSTTEVHSLSMIEAIASGLPVVGVGDEALYGMVADGLNGRITPKEPAAFSLAIAQLLSDPHTRNAFGQVSIAMSQKYSVQAQAATLVELYGRSIERPYPALRAERASQAAAGSPQSSTLRRGPAKWLARGR